MFRMVYTHTAHKYHRHTHREKTDTMVALTSGGRHRVASVEVLPYEYPKEVAIILMVAIAIVAMARVVVVKVLP